VFFPKWGLATGKQQIGQLFTEHVRMRGYELGHAPGRLVARRRHSCGTLVRRVRGARLPDPALLHLSRSRLRRS
jgi:hypothetical protein